LFHINEIRVGIKIEKLIFTDCLKVDLEEVIKLLHAGKGAFLV